MVPARYGPYVESAIRRYGGLKKKFWKKAEYIRKNPTQLGEPLKHDLNGLRSFPLEGNFLILFLVCSDCRRLKQKDINRCSECHGDDSDLVTFIDFGPHDDLYKTARKTREEGV